MKVEKALDPTSLVARIVAELRANPEAQEMLLRVLLTNEFLGMPARLDRIEKDVAELKVDVAALKADMAKVKTDVAELKTDMAEVKADVAELKTDMAEVKTDVAELKTDMAEVKTDVAELKTDMAEVKTDMAEVKTDVGALKGRDLEYGLHRRIDVLASQEFGLRRPEIVQAPVLVPLSDFRNEVEDAAEDGRITEKQRTRIHNTDVVIHAQRKTDRVPVWVAVEASHTVHSNDISRARASADALRAVFGEEAVAVAAGYSISAADAERAEAAGVEYLEV